MASCPPFLSADLSRIRLRKRREMVDDRNLYGTVDIGSPRVMNLVTESITGTKERVRGQTSKSNQLPGPQRTVHQSSAGAFTVELTPGPQLDEMLEEALCNTFTVVSVAPAITISADDADNSLNDSANGFTDIVPGQWIRALGFATASNNTDGQSGRPWAAMVTSKPNDGKIILAYHVLTTEGPGASVRLAGDPLRNGTKIISSTIEREHTDLTTDKFQAYTGQVCASAEISLAFNEILTGVFNMVGQAPLTRSTTSVWDGQSDIAAESVVNTTTDASNNLSAFREGGALNGNIRTFSFTHDNAVEPIQLAMVQDPCGQSLGTKNLTGSLSGYLRDAEGRVVTAFDSTPTDLHIQVIPDVAGHASDVPIYIFTLFRVTYNEMGDTPKSAATGPVPLDLTFEAEESPDYPDAWIQVTRLNPVL